MRSKKIYLIRHGQTDFNLRGIVQGSGIDSSLNQTGIDQANAFYNSYKDYSFDKIYTSSLQRTIQTVDPFLAKRLDHEVHPGLNEINWGNKEGTRITPEEDRYYQWLLKQWQEGKTTLPIEGGESPEDVARRQRPVLDLILSNTHESRILICMHGRAIRVMLCQLLNYPLSAMDIFEHKNLGLYLLSYNGSFCRVDAYNNTDHLRNVSVNSVKRAG